MQYEEPLYRPPSEARSLIFQVSIGCSYNKCLFCGMYKGKRYRVRSWEEIKKDVDEMALIYPRARRIFLADGDALSIDTPYLLEIMDLMNNRFPYLERIASYAGPTNLLHKSKEDLKALYRAKLDIVYLGIETGNDKLLNKVRKGVTSDQMVDGCKKVVDAGIKLSTIILLGLGGVNGSYEHAKDSARIVNRIDPHYLACLTLMLGPFEETYEKKIMGEGFNLLDKQQSLRELRLFVEDLSLTDCVFGTQHASNYLPIQGHLPEDKDNILALIDAALGPDGSSLLRSERERGL